eukprot:SAG11_NODE_803_length_7098_cov_10.219174_4_plen_215_part_00
MRQGKCGTTAAHRVRNLVSDGARITTVERGCWGIGGVVVARCAQIEVLGAAPKHEGATRLAPPAAVARESLARSVELDQSAARGCGARLARLRARMPDCLCLSHLRFADIADPTLTIETVFRDAVKEAHLLQRQAADNYGLAGHLSHWAAGLSAWHPRPSHWHHWTAGLSARHPYRYCWSARLSARHSLHLHGSRRVGAVPSVPCWCRSTIFFF